MKMKTIIRIVIIILLILIVTINYSIKKFDVINPISACLGMLQILFTDKEYTVVQHYPKRVIFSKSESAQNLLDKYMESRKFSKVSEQLGSILVYSNGTEKENIHFSVNGYYSKWIWEN